MLKIGLTGPTGAGKGAFCRYLLKAYGIPSIDADKVYHSLLVPPSECLSEIAAAFGASVLNEDGTLNRKALASVVFGPEDEAFRSARIARLNAITHPRVLQRMREEADALEKSGAKAVVFDVPALYESGFDAVCDLLVTVTASRETRIRRIMERDGLPIERAEERVNAQHSDAFYTEKADAVLYNNGSFEEFESTAEAFCKQYLPVGIL